MTWLDRLRDEATKILDHGEGKLEFTVGPQGRDKRLVLITSGKRYRFLIDNIDED